jgi:hypothetical protein
VYHRDAPVFPLSGWQDWIWAMIGFRASSEQSYLHSPLFLPGSQLYAITTSDVLENPFNRGMSSATITPVL